MNGCSPVRPGRISTGNSGGPTHEALGKPIADALRGVSFHGQRVANPDL